LTWKIDGPQGNESAKVRWELVPYMSGRVLDLGCGPFKTFPHFIGVDNGHHDSAFGWQNKADVVVETCEKLDLFGSNSVDMVFSSHLLEHIAEDNVPATLREWCRVIKHGGHLIIYVPDEDEYPKVGETGANPDHKWNVNYDKVVKYMEGVPRNWDLIDFQKRNQGDEYSLFFVFKIT
jgi:predicted SAM-dependent methyltransferase